MLNRTERYSFNIVFSERSELVSTVFAFKNKKIKIRKRGQVCERGSFAKRGGSFANKGGSYLGKRGRYLDFFFWRGQRGPLKGGRFEGAGI